MSRLSEEEIAKALSLEEAALDEFKLRKGSLPNHPNYSKTSINGKKNLKCQKLMINQQVMKKKL